MLLIERALKCVVFIGMPGLYGTQFTPYGTGFIFSVFHEEIRFDYIVTCYHIINMFKDDKVWIRLNFKDDKAHLISTTKASWVLDPKQDIAILSQPIGDLVDANRIVEKDVVTKEIIEDEKYNILPGELTFLVGLSTIHHGADCNVPIVRLGNIAAIPKDEIWTETGYVKAYLVESRSIGGLSGSPVFLNIGSWKTPWKLPREDDQIDCLFLGMMRGRFNTQDPNDIVHTDIIQNDELNKPTEQLSPELQRAILLLMKKHFLIDDINTGIGIVIPAEVIFNILKQSEFFDQREDTVKKLKKKTHFRPCAATPKSDNPQHKEDFNSLVSAAAKKKPQDG